MDKAELQIILNLHHKWMWDEQGGIRADLRGANLSGSNLSNSDLRGADLSGSNLRGADLRGANLSNSNLSGSDLSNSDLSGSNLRGADLSNSDLSGSNLSATVYSGINWLTLIGINPSRNGKAIAFKMIAANGRGPYYASIDYLAGDQFSAALNRDTNAQCGSGINLANFQWCLKEKKEGYRLYVMEFDCTPENVCCPVGSDGKFRVAQCRKIGVCDWQGNITYYPEEVK